jgi:hypothetical protein
MLSVIYWHPGFKNILFYAIFLNVLLNLRYIPKSISIAHTTSLEESIEKLLMLLRSVHKLILCLKLFVDPSYHHMYFQGYKEREEK